MQVTHTEQGMPPVCCPGKQGIAHAVDSGLLISNTSKPNGLRGAGEYYLEPKGWQSVWYQWPLLGSWTELDRRERLLVVHKGVEKVVTGRQRITSYPEDYLVLNWDMTSLLNHYFSLYQEMLNLCIVLDWTKVIIQVLLYVNHMPLNHFIIEWRTASNTCKSFKNEFVRYLMVCPFLQCM